MSDRTPTPPPGDATDPPWPGDSDAARSRDRDAARSGDSDAARWGRSASAGADRAFPVPFSVAEAALLVVWTLLAQFLVAVPVLSSGLIERDDGAGLVAVAIVSQAVGLAGVVAWLAGRGRLTWRLLGPRRPHPRHLAVGALVGAGGFVGVNLLLAALLALFGPFDAPEQALLTEATRGGLATALAIVAAVVMAPIVEELVFRGLLFQSLHRRVGQWPAALLSSAFFTAVHIEVSQPVYSGGLFLLGVLFAVALLRSGSLLVPIAAHAVFNGVSIALAYASERIPTM